MARTSKVDTNSGSVGANIVILRKRAKLTQKELAAALNIAPSYIGRMETDNIKPSKRLIPQMAAVLKTKTKYFQQSA